MYLNVVAFQIPTPPDYGGAIDVYYRLQTLKELGFKVILHCFYYYDRVGGDDLEALVEKAYYYKRSIGIQYQISTLPYIVRTRSDRRLLQNLCENDYPILFEGLHCCYFLNHPALKERVKWVRMHNIEHDYYYGLSKVASDIFDKFFFKLESFRLKRFEKVLNHAQAILAISESDYDYFRKSYPDVRAVLSYPCHPEFKNVAVEAKSSGDYYLYHANFGVAENVKVAEFLIDNVAGNIDLPLYIAGLNAQSLKKSGNVKVFSNLSEDELFRLIVNAKANLLLTFQPTGMKLKLLNALSCGGFCVVNNNMLAGTKLASTCIVAETKDDIIDTLNGLTHKSWTQKDEDLRQQAITPYDNKKVVSEFLCSLG